VSRRGKISLQKRSRLTSGQKYEAVELVWSSGRSAYRVARDLGLSETAMRRHGTVFPTRHAARKVILNDIEGFYKTPSAATPPSAISVRPSSNDGMGESPQPPKTSAHENRGGPFVVLGPGRTCQACLPGVPARRAASGRLEDFLQVFCGEQAFAPDQEPLGIRTGDALLDRRPQGAKATLQQQEQQRGFSLSAPFSLAFLSSFLSSFLSPFLSPFLSSLFAPLLSPFLLPLPASFFEALLFPVSGPVDDVLFEHALKLL